MLSYELERSLSMKKNTTYIITAILAIALIGGCIFMFSQKKGKLDLSDEEISTYLSYVPTDPMDATKNAYANPSSNTKMNKSALLGAAVFYANENTELGKPGEDITTKTYEKSDIENILLKMYNLNSLGANKGNYSCLAVELKDGKYVQSGGCGGGATEKILSKVKDYSGDDEELTIHEYAVKFSAHLGNEETEYATIEDMKTGKKVDLKEKCDATSYDEYEKCATKYLEDNKKDFTEYAHRYQKNDEGYYWAETSLVK